MTWFYDDDGNNDNATEIDPVDNTLITLTSPRVIDRVNDIYLVSHANFFYQ